MRTRKDSNYPSFEHSLDIDFGKYPPESKKELKIQMMNYRYHMVKDEKENPTEKQLDYAWDYLKRQYNIEQRKLTDYYVTEKYGNTIIHRAKKGIFIRGKLYKRGQFLPRREK